MAKTTKKGPAKKVAKTSRCPKCGGRMEKKFGKTVCMDCGHTEKA